MLEISTQNPEFKPDELDRAQQIWDGARSSGRIVDDDTILRLLANNLAVGGNRVLFIKNYLDGVSMDESDHDVEADNERIASLHDQIIDMVKGHLVIALEPSIMERAIKSLNPRRQEYLELLESYKEIFRKFQVGHNGQDVVPAITLSGFKVPTTEGSIDLTSTRMQGVRLNMQFQREMAGMFVHWDTEALMRLKNRNDRPKTTKRIYLNPKAEALIPVFTAVMTKADAADLPVKGKVWSRSYEFQTNKRSKFRNNYLRGDGIVLYCDDEHANQFLAIVEEVYGEFRSDFANRKTSRIPFPVAEGVAVGDEPKGSGESLTSSRNDLLEEVQIEVLNTINPQEEPLIALKLFHVLLKKKAIERGINPSNLAFNI